MPEWAIRDAAWITAVVAAFALITGRIGAAVTWFTTRRDRAREREEAARTAEAEKQERAYRQWEARRSIRAYQETIELKDMELAVKDRIITSLTAELDRLEENGGAR